MRHRPALLDADPCECYGASLPDRFEDLPWHDATLLELRVDRRRPGHVDEVTLSMRWPRGARSTIRFVECFKLIANMNFNMDVDECVLTATESDDDEALRQQREIWSTSGANVTSLKVFRIELNSTGGAITVVARGWREEDTRI